MHGLIYVLRSSEGASPSLYAEKDSSLVVDVGSAAQPGTIVFTDHTLSLEVGQSLTYKQLLDVLLAANKVLAL